MGVAKPALGATARYLARDLGPRGIRVNLLSAGPIETAAAGGIGFDELAALAAGAPLGWDQSDPTPVARADLFLLSDWAAAISGEVLHADGGFHALVRPGSASPPGSGRRTRPGPPFRSRRTERLRARGLGADPPQLRQRRAFEVVPSVRTARGGDHRALLGDDSRRGFERGAAAGVQLGLRRQTRAGGDLWT